MRQSPQDIRIEDYNYTLPEERIAKFPAEARDGSKLLLYQNGRIGYTVFRSLPEYLPPGSVLLFNDTSVIHARLHFLLNNSTTIEILCIEPMAPHDYQQNFSSTNPVRWKCLIGGNRKWKSGIATKQDGALTLSVTRLQRLDDAFEVAFQWSGAEQSFGQVLAHFGIIPLPPYLNRANEATDQERYQTIYARAQGSVAAPTAGLHFTEDTFAALDKSGIERLFVTLHVGAGTFKPVKSATIADHQMHEESVMVQRQTLERLLDALHTGKPIIPVGTTSMRTLESLYWYGVLLAQQPDAPFYIAQWMPYETATLQIPPPAALQNILRQMDTAHKDMLEGATQLLIAPGYQMQLTSGLITNFHQPNSTLLLLVAALIGEDWRRIYQYALAHDFRFLSYGDSSLLLP